MNEYDVFMKVHADRDAAARAQRNQRFIEDLAAVEPVQPDHLQRAFRSTFRSMIQLIGKIAERRAVSPEDTTCPTPPCTETPIRAS